MTMRLMTTLAVAGVLVVAWGMLWLLTLGLTAAGVAGGIVFAAYGVALIRADRHALIFGWTATALMAAAVAVEGFDPVLVLVDSWLFVLSMFLTDTRDRLGQPRRPSPRLSDPRLAPAPYGAVRQ